MQFVDEEKNSKEELKGDLHGGQLHRQNRAAIQGPEPVPFGGMGAQGGGKGKGQVGKGPEGSEGLTAAMAPAGDVWPCAKGFAEELDRSLFWDGPIV